MGTSYIWSRGSIYLISEPAATRCQDNALTTENQATTDSQATEITTTTENQGTTDIQATTEKMVEDSDGRQNLMASRWILKKQDTGIDGEIRKVQVRK